MLGLVEMVPFDVVTGRSWMISNSEESIEVLRPSVMQSCFSFTNLEIITIPATGFVENLRFLRAVETIFVKKERLNSASDSEK